jgi:hypothetical protein
MCTNPACKTVSALPDAYLGRKVRCKACQTVFLATPLDGVSAAPRSTADSGVITVVARRVGTAAAPGTRSDILGQATMVTPGGPSPSPPVAPRRAGCAALWVVLGVAALLMPVAGAGAFVALNWLSGRDRGGAAAPDEPGQLYGGIEVGSSGVKATVIELFPHKDLGYDYRSISKKSLDTKVVTGLAKAGQFDRAALDDTVNAVQTFYTQMTGEQQVPPERVFIVGSSGLLKALRDRKDLKDDAREELIRKNQAALAEPVEKRTGKKMEFIDVRKEVELAITGLIRPQERGKAVLIDAGTGATRGGYLDQSGVFVTFEVPGTKQFEERVKSQLKAPADFPKVASALADKELRDPLRQELERKTGLGNRDRVYLNGGIVWVLATLLHPEDRKGAYVKLSARDIDDFRALVGRHPTEFPPLTLREGVTPDVRKEVEEDVARMKDIFPPQRLMAGAEVLKALSAEFRLQSKEVAFTRDGDVAWLLAYIGESYLRDKGVTRR